MPTNYTLGGIGTSVEFGVGGPRIKDSSGKLQARDNADSAFANVQGADATVDDDLVTYRQFQNSLNGLNWKQVVRVATTTAGVLATDFENGDTVDGVVLVTGDRLLIKDQAAPIDNGIYIVAAAGAPARASDMAAGAAAANDAMFISEGAAQSDTAWVCTDDTGSDIVGTDPLTFAQFSSVVSGVTSASQLGTGIAILASGTAPVITFNSIVNGAQIAASLASNDITLTIVAGSVDTAELADDAVTEAKLAAAVAVLFRYVQVLAAGFPAAPGTNTVNVGAIMPANTVVQGGRILITAVFNNSPDLEVGVAADVDSVFETTDLLLSRLDSYVSDRMSVLTATTQLIATRTTGAGGQPTTGVAEIIVNLSRVA